MKTNDFCPSLSIIIPAKNEEKYLGNCLDFLHTSLSAWGGDYEIILVDNGSTDSTRDIAVSRGCRIIEVPEATISKLRNIGGAQAKGEILAFLDADCLVAPEWTTCCLKGFENQQIAIIGTRVMPDPENATWVETSWFKLMPGSPLRKGFVEWIGTSNLLIRKKVFVSIGEFDESLETAEDVNLCYKATEKGYLVFLERKVDTIHLRESKTLTELFKREYWRGKNSLSSYITNQFPRKELLSIAVPAVNLLALFVFLLLAVNLSLLTLVPGIVIIGFPLVLLMKKQPRIKRGREALECYLIAFVYIFARSCSLGMEALSLVNLKKNQ